jgi:hypothetical protein
VRNNQRQRIGVAKQSYVAVAVSHQAPFLNPRSRKDRCQGLIITTASKGRIPKLDQEHTTGESVH